MHHGVLCASTRQQQLAGRLDTTRLLLALFDVSLRVVVHPQTDECQRNPNTLDRMHGLTKPDDCDADDCHALEKRCDGVSHWRCRGEDDEGDDDKPVSYDDSQKMF